MNLKHKTGQSLSKKRGRPSQRLIIIAGAVAAVAFLLVWYAASVLLMIFAGVLLAVFLQGLSRWLTGHTPLAPGWPLAAVILSLLLLFGATVWLLAPRVVEQVDQLAENLPRAVRHLRDYLQQYEWGRTILKSLPAAGDLMGNGSNILARATGVFSTTLGVIANIIIISFIGLYLAADPHLYTRGLVRLLPFGRRDRAREILSDIGRTLWWWLLGRILLMAINGALTALGLWLLGVPLALTLGIITGLLNFIPNLGPIMAGVPAVLIALMQSPSHALYVLLLYIALQMIDGYIFTPLVQQRAVDLPPALTIAAQVMLGVLFGFWGLLLATPLAAAALMLVKKVYVEDILGDLPEEKIPAQQP